MIAALLVSLFCADAQSAKTVIARDTLTAREAFINYPATSLELLTRSMRLDMLDYYDVDSICNIRNTMGGVSHLEMVKPDYLKVVLTDVSTLEIKILPVKGGEVVMSIYTVGSVNQAPDSDVRFFNENMQPLETKKFFKTPELADFFNLKNNPGVTVNDIEQLVPFPSIVYNVSQDENVMSARLTVGHFLDKESKEKLQKLEKRQLIMRWNNKKWQLQ